MDDWVNFRRPYFFLECILSLSPRRLPFTRFCPSTSLAEPPARLPSSAFSSFLPSPSVFVHKLDLADIAYDAGSVGRVVEVLYHSADRIYDLLLYDMWSNLLYGQFSRWSQLDSYNTNVFRYPITYTVYNCWTNHISVLQCSFCI